MKNTIAEFGYNTDLEHEDYYTWEKIGTKYNFNVGGNVFGVFSNNNQYFLLSQVIFSYGGDCMVGTIDVREVIIENKETQSDILLSNNEPSKECMTISKMLSNKTTREELKTGKSLEQTKGFRFLEKLGIKLERQAIQFGKKVTVCGIEKNKFENLNNKKGLMCK